MYHSWIVPYRKLKWRKVLIMAAAAYVLAFAVRTLELPSWDNPRFQLDGEYLLGTHDAYHWMAGAEGFGHGFGHPFSKFIKVLSGITGASPANVGFWLPLFMAPLVASVVCLWAMVFGARSSGIVAGVLACLAPGFLGRTLLGYCDTDLVTLLFALLIGLAPAIWLAPAMRSPLAVAGNLAGLNVRRLTSVISKEARGEALSKTWLFALLLSGLFGYWAKNWHSLFSYLTLWYAILIPLAIGLFSIRAERRQLWRGGAVYVLPLVGGLAGGLIGLLIIFALSGRVKHLRKLMWKKSAIAAVWMLALLFAFDPELVQTLIGSIGSYLKSSGDVSHAANATEALVYPGVAQSIIEVQDLNLKDLLFYFHPWMPAAVLGSIGFLLLLTISPAAAFHLPLIALSLLSIKLGGRMVMFGVASSALGMVVPVYLLLERRLQNNTLIANFEVRLKKLVKKLPLPDLFLLFLIVPYLTLVPRLSQGPILNVEHASALKSLRTSTPPDAVIWTWWDWGYATQYLALRNTVADGALHGGAYLYLPALVYSTANPKLASQAINYTSQTGGPPQVFEGMSDKQAMALLADLGASGMRIKPASEQYLVVSFDMLRLGYWIGKHGSWNFAEKRGIAPKINRIREGLKFNLNNGEVQIGGQSNSSQADGKNDPLQADSIDVLQENGLTRESYFRFNQRHFVLNMLNGDKLVLDDSLYNSMMAQLLLSKPGDSRFRTDFTLVFDNGYTKVYRAN